MALGDAQNHFRFHPGDCGECWDSTITITPEGLRKCLICTFGDLKQPMPAAKLLAEVVWLRVEKKKIG